MKLYIVGVRHHDPMGRPRLVSWLKSRSQEENVAPIFIGVEYDETEMAVVIKSRPRMREGAIFFFPNETDNIYDDLTQSLGFEGDAYTEVLPYADVIWLDPNLHQNISQLNDWEYSWNDVLEHYKNWLDQVPVSELTDNILQDISTGAWSGTDILNQDTLDRDEQLAEMVLAHIGNPSDEWAILILGSTHVQDRENSTVDILQKAGVECIVTTLDVTYRIQEAN